MATPSAAGSFARPRRSSLATVSVRADAVIAAICAPFAVTGGLVWAYEMDPAVPARTSPRQPRKAPFDFVRDSLLEGDGFEPSVPGTKEPVFCCGRRITGTNGSPKNGCFLRGTDGSNPSPSSKESVSAVCSRAVGRQPRGFAVPEAALVAFRKRRIRLEIGARQIIEQHAARPEPIRGAENAEIRCRIGAKSHAAFRRNHLPLSTEIRCRFAPIFAYGTNVLSAPGARADAVNTLRQASSPQTIPPLETEVRQMLADVMAAVAQEPEEAGNAARLPKAAINTGTPPAAPTAAPAANGEESHAGR
jgi:hypothetical protein